MNVDLPAKHLIRNAHKLLDHFGQDPSQVQLRLR